MTDDNFDSDVLEGVDEIAAFTRKSKRLPGAFKFGTKVWHLSKSKYRQGVEDRAS
jgi:hypothetical protein